LRILVTGYWLQVSGYWLLVTGYWLLVTGYWLYKSLILKKLFKIKDLYNPLEFVFCLLEVLSFPKFV